MEFMLGKGVIIALNTIRKGLHLHFGHIFFFDIFVLVIQL